MMKPVVLTRHLAGGHRLPTLALARPDRAGNVHRAHLAPPLVAETVDKWSKKFGQLRFPLPHRLHSIPERLRSSRNLARTCHSIAIGRRPWTRGYRNGR